VQVEGLGQGGIEVFEAIETAGQALEVIVVSDVALEAVIEGFQLEIQKLRLNLLLTLHAGIQLELQYVLLQFVLLTA
jgi:hypothetical protein